MKKYLVSLSNKGQQQREWAMEILEEIKNGFVNLQYIEKHPKVPEKGGLIEEYPIVEAQGESVNWVLRLLKELNVCTRQIYFHIQHVLDTNGSYLTGPSGGTQIGRLLSRQEHETEEQRPEPMDLGDKEDEELAYALALSMEAEKKEEFD